MILRFLRDENGATAIEYGLIAAMISVAVIAAVGALGVELSSTYDGMATEVTGALD